MAVHIPAAPDEPMMRETTKGSSWAAALQANTWKVPMKKDRKAHLT
jgi:hypothetical protein